LAVSAGENALGALGSVASKPRPRGEGGYRSCGFILWGLLGILLWLVYEEKAPDGLVLGVILNKGMLP
jgi:hypothetical protein